MPRAGSAWLAAAGAWLGALSGASADEAVPREIARQIVGEGLTGLRAYEALATLTEQIGPRLSGTPGAQRAVEWALAELGRRGLPRVWREDLSMDAWAPGKLTVEVSAPRRRPVRAIATAYSPGTNGAKEGPLVDAGPALPAILDALGSKLGGAVVLMGPPAPEGAAPGTRAELAAIVRCKKAGALAVILEWSRSTVKRSARGAFRELPTVVVSREEGEELRRLANAAGGARVKIDMTEKRSAAKVANVVAEIPGREKPDEIVVVGAHLDSWDLARGAIDNAHGSAAVLEAARLLAAVRPARRTMRFVLFMGEEQGLLGSGAYVERHRAEMDRTVLMINEDAGPGSVAGLYLYLRPEARAGAEDLARAAAPLGMSEVIDSDDGGSDSWSFMPAGVPAVEIRRVGFDYLSAHHTPEDTLDKVPPADLQRLATALALVAYGAAERPSPIAAPLAPEELRRRFPPR